MSSRPAQLRQAGLRVTRQRLAVLAEVAEHPHADVVAITAGARSRLGSLSTQAAYDVLSALTRAGLLRHLEPAGSTARFELQTGDNHHHLVCRTCASIVDVECATGETPCLQARDCAGYLVDEAEVTYWGLCPRCRPSPAEAVAKPVPACHRSTRPHHQHPSGDIHEHTRSDNHPRPTEAGPADPAGR